MKAESQASSTTIYSRVNVSMVSLKWGDILSTLLPGALALFGVAPYFPLLDGYMKNLDKINAASLPCRSLPPWNDSLSYPVSVSLVKKQVTNILGKIDTKNLDLYERGVQSSYKYATFYANFAWAIVLLFVGRLFTGAALFSMANLILGLVFMLLLDASYVQWTYFVNYLKRVFEKEW
ncbi:MAG: hypothetical protein E6J74_15445 [Deltaproteobacteria bacterium]|nr:MAG: hypothetical protein E6J74_15445 [Deltaproteobacteria bacterium]